MFVFDSEKVSNWVCEKAGGVYRDGNTAIGVEIDGKLIAGVMYDGYTGSSISIHSRIDDSKRLPRKFYWIIFDYPFNQLKVKRLTGIVCVNNLKAQRLNEHIGFKREAVLGDYFPEGDAIVYAMYKDDCKFLKDKYVHFSQKS